MNTPAAVKAQVPGFVVGSCARCGKPILVPASDPENHEMDVCGGCGLAVGISEGRAGGVSSRDDDGTRPSSAPGAATPAGGDELEPVLTQTHAYTRFEWDCGETTDERDIDPAYEKRTCEACGAVNEIGETR